MTNIMDISVVNFADRLQGFLEHANIGLFPIGMQSTNYPGWPPYEIVWSTDEDYFRSVSQHALLGIPSLTTKKAYFPNRMSQVRRLFYSGRAEHAMQNDVDPLITEYRQIQDIVDVATSHLRHMRNPREELTQIFKRARPHDMKFRNFLYLIVLQSALNNDQDGMETTAELFETLTKFVPDYVNAYALLLDAAAAHDERSYARPAAHAWARSLPLEPDPIWDPILIFAGLRRCLISEDYDLMTGLLKRLKKLYPDIKRLKKLYLDTVGKLNLRIAWTSLKSAAGDNSDPETAWISAASSMWETVEMWENSTAHVKHWETLKNFAATAEIALIYYSSIYGV